jgi:hypothetical protein
MVARLTGGGGGGDTSNWFSPTSSSWSLTIEFLAWFGFGLENAPRAPTALRTSLSSLYGISLRRDICQHRRDERLVYYYYFLNLLYPRLLYISSNQSHIINKQFIHSFKQTRSNMPWDIILNTETVGTETNTTTPRGLLVRAWHDHPELPCHWSPRHEEMSVEWVALTRTSFYEGRLRETMEFPPRWTGQHSRGGTPFFWRVPPSTRI